MSVNQSVPRKSPWPGVIIGVILFAVGSYMSGNFHPEFLESLKAQGLEVNLGKTVASIGVLIALFRVIEFFYIVPLREAMDARNNSLERTFTEAEDLRAEMGRMRADYERRLAESESAAREQIQAQIREAQALKEQLRVEAVAQADELRKKAMQDIELQTQRAINDIRVEVVDLTLKATEKLLGRSVDDEANRKLLQEFLDTAEVAR
ncbi:MAG: F0F1 ATP synthase subunit B [Fimbriimonadaceae bacterium]